MTLLKKPSRALTNSPTPQSKKLWVAIRLYHLSLESLGIKPSHDNIIISHKNTVYDCSHNLLDADISRGISITTAQLMFDSDQPAPLRIYPRDLESEQQLLNRLCDELYNLTPYIHVYRSQQSQTQEELGIALEVSGSVKLFKGFDNLIERIEHIFRGIPCDYAIADAPNKHMAWLLTYAPHPKGEASQTPNRYQHALQQLAALPLSYASDFVNEISALQKSGFRYFSDVIQHIEKVSFQSIRKRFSHDFCQYLSDILGIDNRFDQQALFQAPPSYYHPQLRVSEHIQFDHPVENSELLTQPIESLLQELTQTLVKHQQQTRKIAWFFYDIHQQQHHIDIHLNQLYKDIRSALELTLIQLESQALPFPVDTLELRCDTLTPLDASNHHLYQHASPQHNHALASTTAKLHARLGEKSVLTLHAKDHHIPELRFNTQSIHIKKEKVSPVTPVTPAKGQRPGWIFNTPVSAGTHQNALFWQGKLSLLQGPERIEGLWWKKPTARDYFIAQRDDNIRLWVFHDLHKDEWFVHGVFS